MFRRTVRLLRDGLTPHLYVFGSAGEGHAVTDAQFIAVCRAFRAEMNTPVAHPMVGVISLSLGTIIGRIAAARDLGFRRFQLSLPAWGALSDSELRTFFAETCGRFPDCDFLHYNLMRTKRLVTAAEYVGLAQRHPNLVATKHGMNDLAVLEPLLREATGLTHFITERGFAQASLLGDCGQLLSVASLNFSIGRELYAAGRARDAATLARLSGEASSLIDILKQHADGVAHMDAAFDKIFCRMHLPDFPLRLLPPYSSFDDAMFARIARAIAARAPHWMPEANDR